MLFQRNKKDYDKWLQALKKLGYSTNTQVLNAKDFGIPQTRERVFALSILNYKGKLNKKGEPKIKYATKEMKSLQSFIKFNPKYLDEYLAVRT